MKIGRESKSVKSKNAKNVTKNSSKNGESSNAHVWEQTKIAIIAMEGGFTMWMGTEIGNEPE